VTLLAGKSRLVVLRTFLQGFGWRIAVETRAYASRIARRVAKGKLPYN